MKKGTARKVVEYSCAAFFQTVLMVIIWPEFIGAVSAFIATVSLVTALVVVFDHFYDDPSDPKNQ